MYFRVNFHFNLAIGARKFKKKLLELNPAGIYLLKVNNRNTRTKCAIC